MQTKNKEKKKRRKKRKRKRVEERKKKKKKRKIVEEIKRKRKEWGIGGVEACDKAAGKGGSPEASGDGGGRLGKVLIIGVVLAGKPDVCGMAFVG